MGTRKLALTCLSPLTSGCYFDRLGIGLRRREVISGFHWLSFFSGPGKWLRQGVFVEDSVDSFRFSLLGPFPSPVRPGVPWNSFLSSYTLGISPVSFS